MNRWLPVAGVMLVLAGILAWESTATEDPAEPAVAGTRTPRVAETPRPDAKALDGIASTVLARPLFNPDRRPPAEPPAGLAAAEAAPEAPPRLAGVIVGPSRRSAIFADSAGHPRIVAEGGTIGRFTVQAIAPNEVTLRSSDGERLLRPAYSQGGRPETVAAERPDAALSALRPRPSAE